MSAAKAFFDTNVLLYMYSNADPIKQARAQDLYREYAASSRILLSTQVVQEFFVAGLRKLKLPRAHVREVATALLDLPLVTIRPSDIREAFEKEARYQVSFWDALVLTAAEAGGAEVVFSEDLSDGQQYGAVSVKNPFA
jgi:predicted nucleic acid-binding protein